MSMPNGTDGLTATPRDDRFELVATYLRTYASRHLSTDVPPRDLNLLALLALSSLVGAGQLPPVGGHQRDEGRITFEHPAGDRREWWSAGAVATARSALATCLSEGTWNDPRLEVRTITEWPDGSILTGPWTEVA